MTLGPNTLPGLVWRYNYSWAFTQNKTRPPNWVFNTPGLGEKSDKTITIIKQELSRMSSYMAKRCFVSETLIRFFPTQGCGSECKAVWGRSEMTACKHGVRRSPQCGGECRDTLNNGKLCPHATIYCSLCSESRWPEHACYCYEDKIDKKAG